MGFPLNCYSVLGAFLPRSADDHLAGMYRRLRTEVTRTFNMVAMVLFDPEDDAAFALELGRRFDRLNRETGECLLFFAAVSGLVPTRTVDEQPLWARLIDELHAPGDYRPQPLGTRAGAAHVLAQAMGIPRSALPCVVFTDDVSRDQWGWCETRDVSACACALTNLARFAENTRPTGLTDLGALAARLASAPTNERGPWWELRPLADDLDGQRHAGLGRLWRGPSRPHIRQGRTHPTRHVAELASGVLGLLADDDGFVRASGGGARVTSVPDFLGDRHEPSDESIYIYATLRRLQCGAGEPDVRFFRHLEQEAADAFRTAYFLAAHAENERLDRGAIAVSVGKALEIEVNGSLVQEVRRGRGAQMPGDYREPSRAVGVGEMPIKLAGLERPLNLNEERKGLGWLAPPIGQLWHLLRNSEVKLLLRDHAPVEAISAAVGKVRGARNVGAHTGAPTAAVIESVLRSVSDIDSAGGFSAMGVLRSSLKPAPNGAARQQGGQ